MSWAKLKNRDIPRIRKLLLLGTRQSKIAKAYGVDPETIRKIGTGENWAGVA